MGTLTDDHIEKLISATSPQHCRLAEDATLREARAALIELAPCQTYKLVAVPPEGDEPEPVLNAEQERYIAHLRDEHDLDVKVVTLPPRGMVSLFADCSRDGKRVAVLRLNEEWGGEQLGESVAAARGLEIGARVG